MDHYSIEPIVTPNVSWFTFLSHANASLGRSPTASLDEAGIAPGNTKTFLAALGEFQNQGTNPVSFLRSRDSDRVLEHLSFTFLVDTTPACMLALLSLGKLNVLSAIPSVALVSGTLRQWREIIIEGCKVQSESTLRAMLNEILRHFVLLGLGDIFSDYELVQIKDRTVALEDRKEKTMSDDEERDRIVKAHLAQLLEHFDVVRIFVSTSFRDEDGDLCTQISSFGKGNFYAQYGMVKSWVLGEEHKLKRQE